ncbi:MAG: phosphoribosylglycinamide formyltransferase [Rhodothermia bacterium]|nr:MAG: phosphoribosylglycinamide formyltransferase [Rhodothermia bacterium]
MRLAVFASGGGSNFQSIVDAAESGTLKAEVILCVSNNPNAGVLDRAKRHEISIRVLDPSRYVNEEEYATLLLASLKENKIDFIALAGYMKMIPAQIVREFSHRMVNIHPALLPAFGGPGMYGSRVHQAVLEAGVAESGATVHLVDEEYDSGPIVLKESVPVRADDTPESLAARVLKVEHAVYPRALSLFADNRIRIDGRNVTILKP